MEAKKCLSWKVCEFEVKYVVMCAAGGWGCNWCINWGWKIPLRAFVGDKSWEIARTYKAVNYHINGVEQHLYSLWMSSTVEGINETYVQIAQLPYQSLLPGVDEDEFIGLLKHKITLLIFPTSDRSPSPPFRINFTVSVTEKVGTNKKLPPMAVPVHPPCNPSTRPCHRQPTHWWSKHHPVWLNRKHIIFYLSIHHQPSCWKSVDWNRRALHLYWTRVRKPTRPYKHISSATFSKQQFQLNLHLPPETTHDLPCIL